LRGFIIGPGNLNFAPQLAKHELQAVIVVDHVKSCILKSSSGIRDLETIVWKIVSVLTLAFPDGNIQIAFSKET
jgi:hypothetical protein